MTRRPDEPAVRPAGLAHALAAAAALGAVAAGLLLLDREVRQGALVDAGERLGSEARQRAADLSAWRRAREGEAAILRQSQSLAALLRAGPRPRPAGVPLRGLSILDDLLQRTGALGALLVAPGGAVAEARPAGQPALTAAAGRAIGAALATGRATWSELHATGLDLELALASPVEGDGDLAGVLLLRLDPARELLALLDAAHAPVAGAECLLVRREGTRVHYLSAQRRGEPVAGAARGDAGDQGAVVAQALAGRTGPLRGLDYAGVEVAAGAAPVPGTDWLVVALAPVAELDGPAQAGFRLGAAAVAVAALGALGWGWRRVRRREEALEREREESERRHRAVVRHFETAGQLSHDILLLLDGDGRVVEANDRAVEAYGYPREALLRLGVGDLRGPGAPESPAELMARARLHGGLRVDTEHRRRDGELFPVEVSLRSIEVGGRTWWQVSGRDISDRRRAEEAARLGELKFRTAFLEAGFGMLLVGRDGRILDHNETMRRLVDRPELQLTGLALRELVHPEQREESRRQLEELMDGRRATIGGEWRYLRADGSPVAVLVRAAAIPDQAGRPSQALAIVEDVSRQRWMEAQLRLADRMASIGGLAAGVAHEINNPLSYIASNVRFALDGVEARDVAPAELADALREALEGATRVRDIVRDLRMLSRAEDSRDEGCELGGVVRTVANMVRHQLRDRATLELEVPDGLVVAGSAGRLGQVLLNLLINAAQALGPGAARRHRVVVRATPLEGQVQVEVQDTGHGIAPEHLGRIFDPFFTTKPVGVGTGLGLSICQGIVTSLGGTIGVESAPGVGTTFRLHLPTRPAPSPAAASAHPAPAAAPLHPLPHLGEGRLPAPMVPCSAA